MRRYEYVSINISHFLTNGGYEHREIIDEYARKGYRYVGYIPTSIRGYGKLAEYDLVFEKDVEEE